MSLRSSMLQVKITSVSTTTPTGSSSAALPVPTKDVPGSGSTRVMPAMRTVAPERAAGLTARRRSFAYDLSKARRCAGSAIWLSSSSATMASNTTDACRAPRWRSIHRSKPSAALISKTRATTESMPQRRTPSGAHAGWDNTRTSSPTRAVSGSPPVRRDHQKTPPRGAPRSPIERNDLSPPMPSSSSASTRCSTGPPPAAPSALR
mmetsp:Transcript_19785/g.50647  ORF Transcript_19785/g.50647 Transcript_19785/m.50647 type:complete len:206 (-) Transcript_19785:508-1125(-)